MAFTWILWDFMGVSLGFDGFQGIRWRWSEDLSNGTGRLQQVVW
jgi:hypothetical protein